MSAAERAFGAGINVYNPRYGGISKISIQKLSKDDGTIDQQRPPPDPLHHGLATDICLVGSSILDLLRLPSSIHPLITISLREGLSSPYDHLPNFSTPFHPLLNSQHLHLRMDHFLKVRHLHPCTPCQPIQTLHRRGDMLPHSELRL